MGGIEGKAAEGSGRIPGERLRAGRMPRRQLLARLGERMLRPGTIELAWEMLGALGIERHLPRRRPSHHLEALSLAPPLRSVTNLTVVRNRCLGPIVSPVLP
jgi:hypothetical protein